MYSLEREYLQNINIAELISKKAVIFVIEKIDKIKKLYFIIDEGNEWKKSPPLRNKKINISIRKSL